jgi:hypothetical protein
MAMAMSTRWWLLLVAALYGLALALPAIDNGDASFVFRGSLPGYMCLIMVPLVCALPGWWANPLLLAGCVLLALRKTRAAWWVGLSALVLASTVFFMAIGDPKSLRTGSLFWLASMVAFFLAAVFQKRRVATDKRVDIHESHDLPELTEIFP